MSDEVVTTVQGKSKKRLVLGTIASLVLSSTGGGYYFWSHRSGSGPAEASAASPDRFAALTPIQPIPISDRADASALNGPVADPYASPRDTSSDTGFAPRRPASSSSVRLTSPTQDEPVVRANHEGSPRSSRLVVRTSNDEPVVDGNSSFMPANPGPDAAASAVEAGELPPAPTPRRFAPPSGAQAALSDDATEPTDQALPSSPGAPVGLKPPQFDTPAPADADSPAAPPARTAAGPALSAPLPDAPGLRSRPEPAASPALRAPAGRPAADVVGDGQPGAAQLEGVQSPSLAVEKVAPKEIQVGRQATFQLKIRNVGRVAAHEIVVLDRVPKGTQLVNATPQFTQTPEGQLLWQLGTLQPGDEKLVSVEVLPLAEGEIGSVAQVMSQTHASARSICTKPELTLTHAGPQKVLIGQPVAFDITVSNSGTGPATGVVMEETVPEGLSHEAGRELEYEIGTLAPGQAKTLRLTLKAAKAGTVENVLLVRGEGNLVVKDTINLEVIAPALQVSLTGPKLRYLEREATYEVGIANPGTAPAKEIEVVAYLPKGMKFVSADHQGQYESQNHAVYWSLEELPANQAGTAKVTVLPLQTGEQKLTVEGRGEQGLKGSCEKLVQVEGVAELQFTLTDTADPIEEGAETSYAITLSNRGSSAATNVRLTVVLPPQLKPTGGDGPTRVVLQAGQVVLDPLARLAPGEQAVYKIKAQGQEAGSHRIQVQLITDETPVPVAREEVTKVYQDK